LQIKISDSKTFLQNIYKAIPANFLQAGTCISDKIYAMLCPRLLRLILLGKLVGDYKAYMAAMGIKDAKRCRHPVWR